MSAAKLKLLFITWSFSRGGGAERVLSNLICELEKTGRYEISLLEVSHKSIGWETLPDDVMVLPPVLDETDNSPLYRIKRFRRRKMLDEAPSRIRDAVRKGKRYDVVVGFNYLYPTFLIYEDEPSISWNHGTIWGLEAQTTLLELQRTAYGHIDIIVAIAQRTRESIVSLFPEFEDKTRIVPNGFMFDTIAKRADEPGNQLEGKPILAIGRLDENKDPLAILEAFKGIRERHAECRLYYLGEGSLLDELKHAIQSQGMSGCVDCLGYQTNPYPYIKQASCILTMSHSEGFQTVIVEGLALGVPFISTPAGSAEELSGNGRFGKVITSPAGAADAFDALAALAQESTWRKDMARFVSQYSIEAQVANFNALVDELMEERRG